MMNTEAPNSRIPAWLLKALHAEWRKLNANLRSEPCTIRCHGEPREGEAPKDAERRVRIEWSRQALHSKGLNKRERELESWKDLKPGEARYLLKKMREESGDGPAYRAMLIAKVAAELFGADWDRLLRERLLARFGAHRPEDLTPSEARAEIEELLSRIARRDGVSIEELRRRFTTNRAGEP